MAPPRVTLPGRRSRLTGNGPTIHIKGLPPASMSERASRGRCRRAEPPFAQSPVRPTRKSKRAPFAMPGGSSSRMKDKSFSTRSVPHCCSRTSITPMDSSATRSTPTPRSFRAACTLRVSPARTATIPTHRSSALQATLSAGNATRPRRSIPRHTITTRQARRAPSAPPAICQRPTIWSSIRATIIRCAFRGRIGRFRSARPTPATNAMSTKRRAGRARPSRVGIPPQNPAIRALLKPLIWHIARRLGRKRH